MNLEDILFLYKLYSVSFVYNTVRQNMNFFLSEVWLVIPYKFCYAQSEFDGQIDHVRILRKLKLNVPKKVIWSYSLRDYG